MQLMRNLSYRGLAIAMSFSAASVWAADIDPKAVAVHYPEIAHAVFADALKQGERLQAAIQLLVANPTEANLTKARAAWIAARVPYQQSEVFRFGNSVVDDWEGQVNAWPLDEGLIDYVAADQYQAELGNVAGQANIIANRSLKLGVDELPLAELTPALLADLNELAGSEANVATGYHAIEFLLWGQDLNGSKAGAGERPATDFSVGKACTGGHCERRVAYLNAVTELLLTDLKTMEKEWREGNASGYRAQLAKQAPTEVLTRALFGMGSLALGELAGERMKVALEASSPEDEHDCFSDNTHQSHFYDYKGIENVYYGRYKNSAGETITGASLDALIAAKDPALAKTTRAQFDRTAKALQRMWDAAEHPSTPMKFDQMIGEGNKEGYVIVSEAIAQLVALTEQLEAVAQAVGIKNLAPDTADHDFG